MNPEESPKFDIYEKMRITDERIAMLENRMKMMLEKAEEEKSKRQFSPRFNALRYSPKNLFPTKSNQPNRTESPSLPIPQGAYRPSSAHRPPSIFIEKSGSNMQTKPSYFLCDETNLVDYQIIKIQKVELSPRVNVKRVSISIDVQESSSKILNSVRPVIFHQTKRYNAAQNEEQSFLPAYLAKKKKNVRWDLEKNKVYIY